MERVVETQDLEVGQPCERSRLHRNESVAQREHLDVLTAAQRFIREAARE